MLALGVAKAWKAYSGGAYAADCANSLAIALGEGIIPNRLNYVCDPAIHIASRPGRAAWACRVTPGAGRRPRALSQAGRPSIEEFMLDTRLFDINMKPYDGQNTLGPWQTMTTVTDTNDINVRVRDGGLRRSNCT